MYYNKLDQFIYDKMSETKMPSVAAASIQDGKVAWSKAFGFANLEKGFPATTRSLYCIGSVSKSFTSLAGMQLCEQGKCSLDDPVEKYLPFHVEPKGEKVRLWHFLSHSSGIPALGFAENVISHAIGAVDHWIPSATVSDMLVFMEKSGEWALNRPGERWFYLNEGYELLGGVVEKISGMSFTEYVKKNIFEPIGMSRSVYSKDDMEKLGDVATPYVTTQDGKRLPSTYAFSSINAAGGVISCVEDMAQYALMYINGGMAGQARDADERSVVEMYTPRVKPPPRENPFGDGSYCLGLGVVPNFMGHRLVQHSGSVGTATAYMGFIPEKKVGAVVLVNGSGYAPSQMGQYGMALALGGDPDALHFAAREAKLTELSGNYETFKGTMKAQVRRAGDFLTLVMSDKYGSQTVPLIPVKLDKDRCLFYTLSAGSRLEVEFIIEGERTTMIYERYAMRKTGKIV